jgi:hypothetical protein
MHWSANCKISLQAQQRREVGALLVGQPARGTRWWPMAKRFRASVASAFHPLTHGSFADAEGLGALALGPALLFEVPGLEPSSFSPVVGCIVHAWEDSTDTSRALDFYTRVSRMLSISELAMWCYMTCIV